VELALAFALVLRFVLIPVLVLVLVFDSESILGWDGLVFVLVSELALDLDSESVSHT
jgi:hypothetical protein